MTLSATRPQPDRAQASATAGSDSDLLRARPPGRGESKAPSEDSIPPDLAAVLHGKAAHPDLVGERRFPTPPPASELTRVALDLAVFAAGLENADPAEAADRSGVWASASATEGSESEAGALRESGPGAGVGESIRARMHVVGRGGVLRLGPSERMRAVAVARGTLEERGSERPGLRPGAVRLVPPGRSLLMADLAGGGALVVDVTQVDR